MLGVKTVKTGEALVPADFVQRQWQRNPFPLRLLFMATSWTGPGGPPASYRSEYVTDDVVAVFAIGSGMRVAGVYCKGELPEQSGDGLGSFEYLAGWILDTDRSEWIEIPARPGANTIYDETVAAAGSSLAVFGGQSWDEQGGKPLGETWIWNPPTQWTS